MHSMLCLEDLITDRSRGTKKFTTAISVTFIPFHIVVSMNVA